LLKGEMMGSHESRDLEGSIDSSALDLGPLEAQHPNESSPESLLAFGTAAAKRGFGIPPSGVPLPETDAEDVVLRLRKEGVMGRESRTEERLEATEDERE
jgi:hypothetical protein